MSILDSYYTCVSAIGFIYKEIVSLSYGKGGIQKLNEKVASDVLWVAIIDHIGLEGNKAANVYLCFEDERTIQAFLSTDQY